MLGTLRAARARAATALGDAQHVVDVGCGGGHMAGALRAAGVLHVTGLDPCPYLLQFAAQSYPSVRWLQATAEDTRLPEASADGATVCFVFHEIPPRTVRAALAELRRIVRPGGRLAVIEPSPVQLRLGAWSLYRRYGWRGLYFRALAQRAFEPFVAAWHAEDFAKLLAENQFRVEIDEASCPLRYTLAVRE
jgi:ubiquinone/menaquinone biosynthesis C-methylase UbiE